MFRPVVGWQYCPPEAVLMRSFWFDPYLWVHLAGIAAVPLFLGFCLLGLAIGSPLFPAWFELLLVGAIGILPILWMQWQRPFSIFSLLLLALKPAQLTEEQRRILQRFKTPLNRILAVLSAVAMAWALWQLYKIAPTVAPGLFPGISRGVALLVAAIAFLGSNLFLQVPVSVLAVLFTNEAAFATTPPYPPERITEDFTIPGIRVDKILPPLLRPLPATAPSPSVPVKSSAPIAQPAPVVPTPVTTSPPIPTPTPAMPKTEADSNFDDEDFDEDFDKVEAAILEEAEIVEELAKAEVAELETAAIDPVESHMRDAMATADPENEAIEAAQFPFQESTSLEESSDMTEEVPISAPPPLAEVVAEFSEFPEIFPELNEPFTEPDPDQETDRSTIAANSANTDDTDSSLTQPVEIVEDATMSEALLADDSVANNPAVDYLEDSATSSYSDDLDSQETTRIDQPNSDESADKPNTDKEEPQQETRHDPEQ